MTVRLHLVCSAATALTRVVGFAGDEPLDTCGQESLASMVDRLPACDLVLCSPALSARQTVEGLQLAATAEPRLRECDFGRWAGRSFEEIQSNDPDAIAEWMENPHAAPHGGESLSGVTKRIAGWMDEMLSTDDSVLVITHALVIRAAVAHALGAGAEIFRHIDVGPLTRVKLSGGGGRWTLASLVPLRDQR